VCSDGSVVIIVVLSSSSYPSLLLFLLLLLLVIEVCNLQRTPPGDTGVTRLPMNVGRRGARAEAEGWYSQDWAMGRAIS
jgi:hypothetical protein